MDRVKGERKNLEKSYIIVVKEQIGEIRQYFEIDNKAILLVTSLVESFNLENNGNLNLLDSDGFEVEQSVDEEGDNFYDLTSFFNIGKIISNFVVDGDQALCPEPFTGKFYLLNQHNIL